MSYFRIDTSIAVTFVAVHFEIPFLLFVLSWSELKAVFRATKTCLRPHWFICYFENRIPLKPALGGVCSLENYSVAYKETQSNRVFDFRNFVRFLFPKAMLFDFYYTVVRSQANILTLIICVVILASWSPAIPLPTLRTVFMF